MPPSFRTSPSRPAPSKPSENILSSRCRHAAIAASRQLCSGSNLPPPQIFELFYIRLACLTIVNATPLAAQESKALGDLNSSHYYDESTGFHVLPWELRVLAVRLQAIGYGDPRRAIFGYYELASDVRKEIKKSKEEEQLQWKGRLKDLGLRVGNALIEMGDLGAAARHLESLRRGDDREPLLDGRLALLHLQLGDISTAKRHFPNVGESKDENSMNMLQPFLNMAENRFEDACEGFRALLAGPYHDLATQNLAVCLVYVGKLDEASALLESLIESRRSFHTLLFNLATIYELCSEKAKDKKLALVERVAGMMEGGERGNVDFKL